ncbi:MAG TPA: phosphotransferase [Burkholderiales bacterium]|nr:phosphotransferase [Burkholderiales bacterium]
MRAWLDAQLGNAYTLAPASADASFRRYFRVTTADGTRIAMDAPPPREDCRPFVKVAALMHEAGVHVPRVLAQDIERGFLLLTDLGRVTYLSAIGPDNADALFSDAIDTLIRWQLASRPGVLPPYDEALLRREMDLFPEWYVARHLGATLDAELQRALADAMTRIVQANLAQPPVYVHRDYMPRNLMVSAPNPGVLDFQDAVYGPITYDVVSLFRDAFVSWDEERVIDWTVRYWEGARKAGLPVGADFGAFYRDFEWMGLQRHLKVLGIFARICYRDGKPDYLADTPRFIAYARAVCGRYGELTGLLRVFDALENRRPTVGYTF